MNYVGVDLHKEQSWFCVLDKSGKRLSSKSISNKPAVLKKYFSTIPKPFTLAVESTYNWYFFVDLAEIYAEKVYLANSYELKAFAKRHKKTDKIDARLIADVLKKGYLPTVFIPSKYIRMYKEILKYRINLVNDRTKNILRLKNLLDKLGKDSSGDFTTYKRLDEISIARLPEDYGKIVQDYIKRIRDLTDELSREEKYITQRSINDVDIKNLISIPGLSYFSATLIKSEIADIKRFASFKRLCSYAGLAPRVSQSGSKKAFHGPLSKNRCKNLQWILLEVVYIFIKASAERKKQYEALKKRKGSNSAKVIFARRMLKIIYHILKEKRSYVSDEKLIQSVAATAL